MMLLNLTSPEIHKTLKLRATIAIVRTAVVVLTLGFVGFLASTLIGASLLGQKAKTLQADVERSRLLLKAQGQTSIGDTTKRLNAQVTTLQGVQKRYVQWTPIIAQFAALTPLTVHVRNLHLDQRTGQLSFDATATTREAYVAYEKILQDSPLLQDVRFPLQTQRTDITFASVLTLIALPKP